MIKVSNLWTPTGLHGTVVISTKAKGPITDEVVQASVLSKLRQLIGPAQFAGIQYDDIKVCLTKKPDGSTEVFFELVIGE